MKLSFLIIFAISICFNATANILLRLGMRGFEQEEMSLKFIWSHIIINPLVLGGIFCFGVALVAFSYVVSKAELSYAYPINVSLGMVIVTLVTWLFMNEDLNLARLLGIALITAGVWLLAVKS